LYAIKNGAKFIYDTDDDNAPIHDLLDYFIFDEFKHGLVYDCQNSSRIMNPYAHFGQPMIWPRGYPLSEIHKIHSNQYICGKRKTSTVQQGKLIFDLIFFSRICHFSVKISNAFEICTDVNKINLLDLCAVHIDMIIIKVSPALKRTDLFFKLSIEGETRKSNDLFRYKTILWSSFFLPYK